MLLETQNLDDANCRKKAGVGIPNNVVMEPRLEGCGGFIQKRRNSQYSGQRKWPVQMSCEGRSGTCFKKLEKER